MPNTVIFAQTASELDACSEKLQELGHGLDSITSDLDTAVRLVEMGQAKILLAADPRALGGRLAEVEQRVTGLGGHVMYASPPRDGRAPDPSDKLRRGLRLLEEAATEFRSAMRDGQDPPRGRRRPPAGTPPDRCTAD